MAEPRDNQQVQATNDAAVATILNQTCMIFIWLFLLQLYMWGRGEHGRLGLGTDNKDKLQPVRVEPLAGEHIVHVSCGGSHSAALTKNGQLYVVRACARLVSERRALVLELTSVSDE